MFKNVLLQFLFFSFAAGTRFLNIYKSDNKSINGIISNGFSFAFLTENLIVFGEIQHNLTFLPTSNAILTQNLSQNINNLLEFKFIDKESVFVCNRLECCICKNQNEQENFTNNCIHVISTQISSVNAEKVDDRLFLRTSNENFKAEIYSFKFKNAVWNNIGKAIDRGSISDTEIASIYSFSHNSHIYFISRIKRNDLAMELLLNLPRKNIDIVITQICNSDESDDLISRMDLILTCPGTKYDDETAVINNVITSALYLKNNNSLIIAIKNSLKNSTICKFDMGNVETEFSKTWRDCQRVKTFRTLESCKKESYDAFADSGCLKFEWKMKVENPFLPFCQKFGHHSLEYLNNCEAAKPFPKTNRRFGWIENIQPFYGEMIRTNLETTVDEFYLTDDFIYAFTNDKKLQKFSFEINAFNNNLTLFITTPNKKFITPLKRNDGILYINPKTKNNIYYLNTSCENEKNCDKIFFTDSYQCGLCPSGHVKSSTSCNLEMENICSPFWFKTNNSTTLNSELKTLEGVNNNNEKFHCEQKPSFAKDNCTKPLKSYLKPFFTVPMLKEFEEISSEKEKNKISFFFFTLVIFLTISFISASFFAIYYWRRKILKNGQNSNYMKKYLISNKKICFGEKIGSGFSSDVYTATYKRGTSIEIVAAKELKFLTTFKEIKNISQCEHSNIVKFYGWMTKEDNDQICIITELMTGGDLESYLKNPDRLLLLSTISSYIFQSLDAMAYLSHKHIMHRDLAARNCLLNVTYEKLKLNDFGLSRETNKDYEYISETNPQLPFRWHPLETLVQGVDTKKTFTDKGDTWSFGILIWEMFERGRDLYDGMGLVALRTFLYDGGRLAQPKDCPDELYQIMKRCWNKHPEDRPNFDVLQIDIKNVFEQIKANDPYSLNKSIECNNFVEIINPNYVYEKPNSL